MRGSFTVIFLLPVLRREESDYETKETVGLHCEEEEGERRRSRK